MEPMTTPDPNSCFRCGAAPGLFSGLRFDARLGAVICPKCAPELERDLEEKARLIAEQAETILVTTTPGLDGYRVDEYLGIEGVEFVIGTGVFSEFTTDLQDFFGKRSTAFESKLQVARREALQALKFLAAEKGANAIVGIDLDYTEFSGNRIGLIANGTLVRVSEEQKS